ncbi:TadE family type IV pilus minor pilin [Dermatophilaceae bacterium Soc4.6]
MVTAELALAIPALVLVLAVVLGALTVGVDRVRCVDAARVAARGLARGDPLARALVSASQAGPPGARTSTVVGGSQVSVTVAVRRSLPLLGWGLDVSSTAVADLETVDDLGGGSGP